MTRIVGWLMFLASMVACLKIDSGMSWESYSVSEHLCIVVIGLLISIFYILDSILDVLKDLKELRKVR